MTDKEKLDALVADMAETLRPMVAEIESSTKMTQCHYGRYMSLITQLSGGDKTQGRFIALALIEAGGNKNGVNNALHIHGW